jgi:pimeloyl-ACP methyl ester carboxylesterase
MRRRLAILVLCAAGPGACPRDAVAAPPADAKARALVEAWFEAAPRDRAKAFEALAPYDELTPAEAEAWRKPLLALAAKGPRSPGKGRNHLYEKPERGLYLLGGVRRPGGGLVVALHGGGAGAGDAGEAASAFGGAVSSLGMWMAAPEVLEKTERGWTEPPETETFVMEMVETLKRTYRIDPNRVYLVGHSMGGYGTWTLGAVHADVFAGLAAFAGAPTCVRSEPGGPITQVQDGILPNLRNLPIYVYQSLDDRNVPPESNLFAVPELDRLAKEDPGGYEHVFEKVDGRGHGFPEKGPTPGMQWMAKHVREPRPKTVTWQPSRLGKRHFYWLWWDPPRLGDVVTAKVAGPNRFEVASSGEPAGLSILLDERLADLSKEVVVALNGKEAFRGVPRRSLRTMVKTAARNDADLLFVAEVPVARSDR